MSGKKRYFLIVDGSSLLATSYYATLPKAARKEKDEIRKEQILEKTLPKNAQGIPVNALQQFFHTLFTILLYQRPSHLAICWDISRRTFRKDLWPAYKDNRSATPPSLRVQFEEAYRLCDVLGLRQIRDQEYEADDFAGSLANAMEPYMPVRILTRDKDYFQLISSKTRIWYGMADQIKVRELRRKYEMEPHLPSKVVEIDEAVLKREFGCTPSAVIMLKSLFGDASDNIPGVSGMGEHRSLSLAMHYCTPQDLYKDIDQARNPQARKNLVRKWRTWGIVRSPMRVLTRPAAGTRKSAREMAHLCYTLGQICTDIDLEMYLGQPFSPDLFRFRQIGPSSLRYLKSQNVKLPALEKKLEANAKKRQQKKLEKSKDPLPEKHSDRKQAKKPSQKAKSSLDRQKNRQVFPDEQKQPQKNSKQTADSGKLKYTGKKKKQVFQEKNSSNPPGSGHSKKENPRKTSAGRRQNRTHRPQSRPAHKKAAAAAS